MSAPAIASGATDRITPVKLHLINWWCRRHEMERDKHCYAVFGCKAADLSGRAADVFLLYVKGAIDEAEARERVK